MSALNPESSSAPPSPQAASCRLVVLLGAFTAFAPLAIDMYLPAFPAIADELHTSLGAVELTVSIFLAGMAAGQAIYGPMADRWGRRAPLIAGATIYGLAAIGCGLTSSIGGLLAGRLIMALGGSAGLVVARAVVRDIYHARDAARLFAQLMLVMGAAPVFAPLVGGQLLEVTGWRGIFGVLTVFGFACAVAAAAALPETLPRERRTTGGFAAVGRTFRELGRHREFVGLTLAAAFGSGVLFAYITGAAEVFITQHGMSPQRFGLCFSANAVAIIGASQINRRLIRTRAVESLLRRAYQALVVTALALAVAGATGWGGLPVLWALLFAALATLGVILPNTAALAMEPFGRVAGSASSLLGTTQYVIGGTAGALVGLLHSGNAVPMTATIAVSALAGFAALRWSRAAREARRSTAPDCALKSEV